MFPGDVVLLIAGDGIPGDCYLLESKDLGVNEATLTGETFPANKNIGMLAPEATLLERTNTLYLGTHVMSGSEKAIVVRTGKQADIVFEELFYRLEFYDFL